jgi:hypothetical protein
MTFFPLVRFMYNCNYTAQYCQQLYCRRTRTKRNCTYFFNITGTGAWAKMLLPSVPASTLPSLLFSSFPSQPPPPPSYSSESYVNCLRQQQLEHALVHKMSDDHSDRTPEVSPTILLVNAGLCSTLADHFASSPLISEVM